MDLYRVFGWLIPGLCMAGAATMGIRQNANLNEAQGQRDAAILEVQTAKSEKAVVDAQGTDQRYAAAKSTDLEQTRFLSDLRNRVTRYGATITNWTTQAAEYGKAPAVDPATGKAADPKEGELLTDVVRVSSTLTLSGSYSSIQGFLRDLTFSDRLFTLGRVTWTRTKEGTNLIVTVSRYVAPEGIDTAALADAIAEQPTVSPTTATIPRP